MNQLLENYKSRLAISERYYAQNNGGAKMSADKKLTTAACLQNISNYINESFASTAGTQRADLGNYKKLCLDVTTLTVPNLVINDLLMVKPMTSFSGYVIYMEYGLGAEKGGVGGRDSSGNLNTITNNPFTLGVMNQSRADYTSERVTETFTAASTPAAVALAWGSAKKGVFTNSGSNYDVRLTDTTASPEVVSYANLDNDGKIPASAQTASHVYKVAYIYENIETPQAKLPTLIGHMAKKNLEAKCRRIAVAYNQIAAYESKTDYGVDFEAAIVQQAQSELQYQLDAEAVMMLRDAADSACSSANGRLITWVDEELDQLNKKLALNC